MNKVDRAYLISMIMEQYRWEIAQQSWLHKRFGCCSKCKSLYKQLREYTIQLKEALE